MEPELAPPALHEVPVMYGGEYGPDLEFVCEYCGLEEDEVIEIHTASVYAVFSVGSYQAFRISGHWTGDCSRQGVKRRALRFPKGPWALPNCKQESIRSSLPAAGASSERLNGRCSITEEGPTAF